MVKSFFLLPIGMATPRHFLDGACYHGTDRLSLPNEGAVCYGCRHAMAVVQNKQMPLGTVWHHGWAGTGRMEENSRRHPLGNWKRNGLELAPAFCGNQNGNPRQQPSRLARRCGAKVNKQAWVVLQAVASCCVV